MAASAALAAAVEERVAAGDVTAGADVGCAGAPLTPVPALVAAIEEHVTVSDAMSAEELAAARGGMAGVGVG